MNMATGLRLILKENEESCFWESHRDAGGPEVSKQHVKPSTGSCEQFLFSQLFQATQKKKKKSHADQHTCTGRLLAFQCAFWLSFLHTCHRMAQRGLAAAVLASLKRLSRGLLACRWCWVTRARACRTQMEARRGRSSLDTHQETQHDSSGWDPGGPSAWESPITTWRA